ncbi:MAG: hypothetical protein EHM89_00990 [Acidobacteria bacterium]|nr:MAG: hypothetical protein EHM89_00990 [Acidobacteriota bacterium]
MDYSSAADQISAIHEQLAKAEIYRGYRPVPVALSGFCGVLGSLFQPYLVPRGNVRAWVLYWGVVAVVSGLVAGSGAVFSYLWREPEHGRRRTRRVLGQLGPALVAGGVITLLGAFDGRLATYLPGLWAMVFGLGIFASRPYLPRTTGWVALYYLTAGALLLAFGKGASNAWTVGGTFAIGQIGTAAALTWNRERVFDA